MPETPPPSRRLTILLRLCARSFSTSDALGKRSRTALPRPGTPTLMTRRTCKASKVRHLEKYARSLLLTFIEQTLVEDSLPELHPEMDSISTDCYHGSQQGQPPSDGIDLSSDDAEYQQLLLQSVVEIERASTQAATSQSQNTLVDEHMS